MPDRRVGVGSTEIQAKIVPKIMEYCLVWSLYAMAERSYTKVTDYIITSDFGCIQKFYIDKYSTSNFL